MFKMTDNEPKLLRPHISNSFEKNGSKPSDSSCQVPTEHHKITHYALPTFGTTQQFPWPNTT